MQRRVFVKGIAAGMMALPVMPGAGQALASRLENLRSDLAGHEEGAEFRRRMSAEFALNPGLIHMNTGSIGAAPGLVVDALCNYARQLEGDPLNNVWGGIGDGMEAVRARAAEFLGAETDEVAITRNTTEAMNMTAEGLHLEPGDEVLTSDHEHGGGMVCWQYLARHRGIRVRYIEITDPVQSPGQIVELVERHLTPRTRVCSFSHVCTITGMIFPMAQVARITRPRGIMLVCDGAQGPGMLNVDVKKLDVDMYCSSSHKWMLAPKGSGLLYIRKEAQDRIRPLSLHSGYRVYSASGGTRNVPTILAHGVAMDFHNAIGRDRIEQHCRRLSWGLREQLSLIPGMTCISPEPPEMASGMCTLAVDPQKASAADLASRLYQDHRITVKTAQSTYAFVPAAEANPVDHNALRFSTHVYNDAAQVEHVVDTIRRMLA